MAEREAHWREFEMVAVVIAVARTCLADGPPPTNLPAPSCGDSGLTLGMYPSHRTIGWGGYFGNRGSL